MIEPTYRESPARASSPPPSTPLVGRAAELALLDEALAAVLATRTPEVVTVVGSAGIGKSRLLSEFQQRLHGRERRVRCFRGACRPGGSATGVVERILRARFGLTEAQDPESERQAFRQAVTETLGDPRNTEFLHFLGTFLHLRFPETALIKAVDGRSDEFGRVSRAVLRRFLELDALESPLVLILEDLHWAPDDSLELVEYLAASLRDAPILLVCAGRPDLLARRAGWAAGARGRRVDLAPLAPDESAALVRHLLAPCADPPEELVRAAVDMAGGSPYLLEQMVRAFHEAGALVEGPGGRWSADVTKLERAELPLTVEDAIAARVAGLAPTERTVLEMAAVTGSVFWAGTLVALSRTEALSPELWGGQDSSLAHLRDLLRELGDRDYVLAMPDSSIPGEEEYAFKHNLERERLERLLHPDKARAYHLVVAEWLEFRLGARSEEHCELLAQHYEAAGASVRAGRYYVRAGDAARARFANAKAAGYYRKGLELIADRDVRVRMHAVHHYGDVLQLGGQNDEALAAFKQMLELSFRLDLKAKAGAAHNRIGRLYRATGHLEQAMRHLGTGHALFDAAGDVRGVASSLDDVGKVHWMRGAYEPAESFMKQALELRRQLGDARSIALSLNNLGLVYQDSGRFEEALECFHEALAERRAINDRPGIAQTLNNLGTIHQDAGDHVSAAARYTEAFEVAREVGDWMRQAVILTNLGESKYRTHEPREAIRVLKQAEDISVTLGDLILEGEVLRGLAKGHALTGDLETARSYIDRSVDLFERAKGKPFLAAALRTLGEIYAALPDDAEGRRRAEEAFERSIRICEEVHNEIELAAGSEAYARFLKEQRGFAAHSAEVVALEARAREIRARVKRPDHYGLPRLGAEDPPSDMETQPDSRPEPR